MKALRQAVYDNIDEYREIVEDPIFKQHFPQVGETFLKTAPKGFPRDFEHLRYLQCKEFTVACMLPDDFFLQADCAERSARIFKIMKPFCDFLNFTIDEEEACNMLNGYSAAHTLLKFIKVKQRVPQVCAGHIRKCLQPHSEYVLKGVRRIFQSSPPLL